MRAPLPPLLLALTLPLLAACLDHEQAPGEEPEEFIALQRDFAPFLGWERTLVGEDAVEGGHVVSPRYVYLNQRPASGADHFPVGTMLVKAAEQGEMTEWQIHAMVKRGGGFNEGGAFGWEWFDLELTEDAVPVIRWRGAAPPDGEGYGGDVDEQEVTGDCNTCHMGGAANDFVLSPALSLEAL